MIKLGQRLKNSVVGIGIKYAPTAFTMGQRAVPLMNVLSHPITQAVAHNAISVLKKVLVENVFNKKYYKNISNIL
jgi:hypothetical protein